MDMEDTPIIVKNQLCVMEYASSPYKFYVKRVYDNYFVLRILEYGSGVEVMMGYDFKIIGQIPYKKNISFATKDGLPVLYKSIWNLWGLL